MDPISLLSLGGSVLKTFGGLFQKKQKPGLDLAQMRRDAEANGVNFLTLLRTTGGAGYSYSAPRTHPLSLIGDGLSTAGDVFAQAEQRKLYSADQAKRHQVMDAQIKQIKNAPLRSISSGPSSSGGSSASQKSLFQLSDSRFAGVPVENIPYWPMLGPDGREFGLRATYAERLGLGPGSQIIVEDYEAILGELGSEAEGIGTMVSQGLGIGSPLMLTSSDWDKARNPKAPLKFPTPVDVINLPAPEPNLSPKNRFRDPDPQSGWMDRKFK